MKKILIIGLFLLTNIFYHNNLIAHDTGEKWIQIDGKSNVIIDNPIQNPSRLPWAEHFINRQFKEAQIIKFEVDKNVIKDRFSLSEDSFEVKWEIEGVETLAQNEFSKGFKTGNYFLTVSLIDKVSQQIIDSEQIMFVVGKAPEQANVFLNGTKTPNSIYKISRDENIVFSIDTPGENFNYTWDLADQEIKEGITAEKVFKDTKLPAYVILRKFDMTTNIFTDTVIRLESDEVPTFVVQTPAVKVNETPLNIQTIDYVVAISKPAINPVLPFSLIFFVIIVGFYTLKRLYRNSKR